MNHLKSYIPVFISLLLSVIIIVVFKVNSEVEDIKLTKEVYNVYLDGKLLGTIKSEKELELYIDKEQKNLKKQYGVKKVYVPSGIDIKKTVTHKAKIMSVKKIYSKIKAKKGFNIKGYVVSIGDGKEEIKLNLLKKGLFDDAVNRVVKNFINTKDIKNYRENTQPEIKTTGSKIENIEIEQNITIKESFISTEDQIYSDVESLAKYLLFGTSDTNKEYIVKLGDTIETVSFNNKLSTDEFLIVNPEFTNSKNLLSVGQKVNIALISPVLKIAVEKHVIEDMDKPFETIEKEDPNMNAGETKVETEGVKGVQRVTEKIKTVNGDTQQVLIVKTDVIKEPVNKVVVKGTKKSYSYFGGEYNGGGTIVQTSGEWAWPTVSPYIVGSNYGYRWGKLHAGIDINCGYGSPIYNAKAGTVVSTVSNCPGRGYYGSRCGAGYGNSVTVDVGGGIQVIYAHMGSVSVSTGQRVGRGQTIGTMGNSGSSTGTHLHFGIYYGAPLRGGRSINPLTVY